MTGRTAWVGCVTVVSAGLASAVRFGDLATFTPVSRALAVARELDHRSGGDVYFASYPIFARKPPYLPPVGLEPAAISGIGSGTAIDVGSVRVVSVTGASMVQAGTIGTAVADTRIKHFRQFASLPERAPADWPADGREP